MHTVQISTELHPYGRNSSPKYFIRWTFERAAPSTSKWQIIGSPPITSYFYLDDQIASPFSSKKWAWKEDEIGRSNKQLILIFFRTLKSECHIFTRDAFIWKNCSFFSKPLTRKIKNTWKTTETRTFWRINYLIYRTIALATAVGQVKNLGLKIRNCDRFWIQNFLQNHLWGPEQNFFELSS